MRLPIKFKLLTYYQLFNYLELSALLKVGFIINKTVVSESRVLLFFFFFKSEGADKAAVTALTGELLWPRKVILKLRKVSNWVMMSIPGSKCFFLELL